MKFTHTNHHLYSFKNSMKQTVVTCIVIQYSELHWNTKSWFNINCKICKEQTRKQVNNMYSSKTLWNLQPTVVICIAIQYSELHWKFQSSSLSGRLFKIVWKMFTEQTRKQVNKQQLKYKSWQWLLSLLEKTLALINILPSQFSKKFQNLNALF